MTTAIERIRKSVVGSDGKLAPLRVMAASGQLGYGIPDPAFNAGLECKPHLIGADMGSIDPGPYYLGSDNNGLVEHPLQRQLGGEEGARSDQSLEPIR